MRHLGVAIPLLVARRLASHLVKCGDGDRVCAGPVRALLRASRDSGELRAAHAYCAPEPSRSSMSIRLSIRSIRQRASAASIRVKD